jgi:amino acid adenylation domain-containing protein
MALSNIEVKPPAEELARIDTEPQLAPLTDGQESLYILSRLANGLGVYNMPFAFRLRGPLNMRAFLQGLRFLTARHSSLRTNIIETDKGFRQWIWGAGDPALEFHDLARGADSNANLEETLAKELRRCASEPFDLARQSPFRADVFHLADDDHVALFTLHHAFGDIAAVRILFRDFEAAYSAALTEGADPAVFPEIAVQMDQYAQRAAKSTPPEHVLHFWRERIAGLNAELELPTDAPRPRMPSFRGGVHYTHIPATIVSGMKTLARANKCSPYMAFLAALEALIYRYTNQRKFALATPFTQRQDPELDNTVGYLINLLPIPCSVNPQGNFRELLNEARKNALEVFANQDISLRRILQEAKITGENPRNGLSRVVFQYFAEGPALLALPNVTVEPVKIHTATSKFDLSITLVELESGGIEMEIEHDNDLYSAETAERIGQHFVNLADAAARNPETPIAQLGFLTASEKALLAEVNETKTSYPRDATVDELFEQQAANHPTKMALSFENSQITYGELDRRANQVAQMLIKNGVRPGDFVGVCLERSPALVAALIGILKAGAAFVPFDAKYPAARLQYMFADAGVRLLLTSASQRHIAPSTVTVALVEEASAETLEPKEFPQPPVGPDSLAYMMYTSGSTGDPKGTTVPHRAIVRLVRNNDFANFGTDEVFLLLAPVSFDASTLEIWGALLNGGTLAIYPPTFESLDQLDDVLAREKVTTLWLSSGLFNTVVDKKIEALRGLRQLLVGGDVVSPAHVRRVYDTNPNVTIINGYGPTENTTFTCCYSIPRDWPVELALPIGRPIRNTTVYILDENQQPMPAGVPGELHCGGDGLSHGYWNKPELTAQAFVAHPFSPGARLYRTGDRVRLLRDGNLEFLGRLDSQIKIRGFRIELGEIENALRKIEGVEDAAAVVEACDSDGKRLLAFVTARNGAMLSGPEMHEALHQSLPDYACPSRIHVVAGFPLGANGKVDKKALLANAPKSAEAAVEETLNPTETIIARVWRDILDAPAIGADENFFHLGGDSLRAIQAVLQINRAVGSNLTVSHIFEAPTIRMLARKAASAQASEAPLERIQPRASSEVADLSDDEVNALLNEMLLKSE